MSFLRLLGLELRAILTNPAIVLTVFGGILLYSFLYPQPYLNQLPHEQKIVLIDQDQTNLSRKIARMVDASSKVKIVKKVYNISQAEVAIKTNQAKGYLLIPKNFYKNVKLEKSPSLAYGGDASYFLIYGSIAESIFHAVEPINEQIQTQRRLYKKTISSSKPSIQLKQRPVFNSTLGYINYVIPAIFTLILHQVMVIGAGLQGSLQTEIGNGYWFEVATLKLLGARFLAYYLIYLPAVLYYFGFCFDFYGVSVLAKVDTLILFIFVFIFSATSLGILLGELIPRRELVTFLVLISSMPLVFTAGFIWPIHLIPDWLSLLVNSIPVIPAIISLVKLNQMGADFASIYDGYLQILLLGIIYTFASFLLIRFKKSGWGRRKKSAVDL